MTKIIGFILMAARLYLVQGTVFKSGDQKEASDGNESEDVLGEDDCFYSRTTLLKESQFQESDLSLPRKHIRGTYPDEWGYTGDFGICRMSCEPVDISWVEKTKVP